MIRHSRFSIALLAQFLLVSVSWAQAAAPSAAPATGAPDEVLAENASTKLTRADYNADLQRIPPENRAAFASDPKRIGAYLTNLMLVKTLAAEGRKAGLDNDPQLRLRIELEADRLISEKTIKRIEDAAGADFDARQADFVLQARETYLTRKESYRVPEQVSVSHILFETRKRAAAESLTLAEQARAKLLAGADFATTARQVSDDPSVASNGGALGYFSGERVDAAFSKAAFALKNVGDISEPVLSRFGYHLIKLDGRRASEVPPFETVKTKIMTELRDRYIAEQREAKLNAIRNDPDMKVNKAAVDSLVFRADRGAFDQPAPKASPGRGAPAN